MRDILMIATHTRQCRRVLRHSADRFFRLPRFLQSSDWASNLPIMKYRFLHLSCWALLSVAPISLSWGQEEGEKTEAPEEEKAEELVSIFEDKGLEDAVRKQVFAKKNSD